MKKTIGILVITLFAIAACNQTNKKIKLNPNEDKVEAFQNNPLIKGYLSIAAALGNDDSKAAAGAGKSLAENFKNLDPKTLNAKQNHTFLQMKDDMIENAEHIAGNANKIEHQREHFKMLSEDMYDFFKVAGSPKTLYKINCPMYKNGSFWLSITEDINNPYMGQKMSSCGSVEETIK